MNREKEYSSSRIKKKLEDKGIHPSYHRLKIMEYLMKNRTHPTADIIYKEISKEILTLSKTTIYNTLSLFQKKRLISALTIDEHELLYDSNTTPHAHFRCNICGSLYDVDFKLSLGIRGTINGHRVEEQHIYFKGVCRECLKKS